MQRKNDVSLSLLQSDSSFLSNSSRKTSDLHLFSRSTAPRQSSHASSSLSFSFCLSSLSFSLSGYIIFYTRLFLLYMYMVVYFTTCVVVCRLYFSDKLLSSSLVRFFLYSHSVHNIRVLVILFFFGYKACITILLNNSHG